MKKAIVLLSGGLDSATCLALARSEGYECHTMAFDYGQRHRAELAAAEQLAQQLGAASHRVVQLGMGAIGGSSLIGHDEELPEAGGEGVPSTYVPARNTVFLSLALGLAEVVDAEAIFIGIHDEDSSGYPDCRPEFLAAFQRLANAATVAGMQGRVIQVLAPLLALSKAEIIKQGVALGVDYSLTISCYDADNEGRACGRCESCTIRRQGFAKAGVADQTLYA